MADSQRVLSATVIRGYRTSGSLYDPIKKHTGVDLSYTYEDLPSPITGTVKAIITQKEMGLCLYITDNVGSVHVFAHLSKTRVLLGQRIQRGQLIAVTGNTGTATSGPHLHYEVITPTPYKQGDAVMTRNLPGANGFNTHPRQYTADLYVKYDVVF